MFTYAKHWEFRKSVRCEVTRKVISTLNELCKDAGKTPTNSSLLRTEP